MVPPACPFFAYTSSDLEMQWLSNVERWQKNVCDRMSNASIDQWLRSVRNATRIVSASSAPPPEQRAVLSWLTYQPMGAQDQYVHVPIEPTAGLARDPRKCWEQMTQKYTQSKEYLLLLSADLAACQGLGALTPSEVTRSANHQKRILFDAGATVPRMYRSTGESWTGTGWIFNMYKSRGIHFDEVHAWEPTKQDLDPKFIDKDLFKVLFFYNRGVQSHPKSIDNPLLRIKELCRPQDLCVFKLDIDTTEIEMAIVRQLLSSDELMGLVDEFFFEHHVCNYAMRLHGLGGCMTKRTDLASWYKMVTPARKKGFRMHFWP
jgi:hypothetical protein